MSNRTKWVIDPANSQISFSVKHLMISNIKGVFKKFEASIYTDGDTFKGADVDFWMNPSSIDTGNVERDKELRGANFFDVDNYKQITFSGILENTEKDTDYELWGDLTIKGNTKRVKFDVEFGGLMKDLSGKEKAGFSIHGKINRKELGLTWNTILTGGGVMVSDDVKISCDVEIQKIIEDEIKIKTNMAIEEEDPMLAVI